MRSVVGAHIPSSSSIQPSAYISTHLLTPHPPPWAYWAGSSRRRGETQTFSKIMQRDFGNPSLRRPAPRATAKTCSAAMEGKIDGIFTPMKSSSVDAAGGAPYEGESSSASAKPSYRGNIGRRINPRINQNQCCLLPGQERPSDLPLLLHPVAQNGGADMSCQRSRPNPRLL